MQTLHRHFLILTRFHFFEFRSNSQDANFASVLYNTRSQHEKHHTESTRKPTHGVNTEINTRSQHETQDTESTRKPPHGVNTKTARLVNTGNNTYPVRNTELLPNFTAQLFYHLFKVYFV